MEDAKLKDISEQYKETNDKAQENMKNDTLEFVTDQELYLIVHHEMSQYIEFQRQFYNNIIMKLKTKQQEKWDLYQQKMTQKKKEKKQ